MNKQKFKKIIMIFSFLLLFISLFFINQKTDVYKNYLDDKYDSSLEITDLKKINFSFTSESQIISKIGIRYYIYDIKNKKIKQKLFDNREKINDIFDDTSEKINFLVYNEEKQLIASKSISVIELSKMMDSKNKEENFFWIQLDEKQFSKYKTFNVEISSDSVNIKKNDGIMKLPYIYSDESLSFIYTTIGTVNDYSFIWLFLCCSILTLFLFVKDIILIKIKFIYLILIEILLSLTLPLTIIKMITLAFYYDILSLQYIIITFILSTILLIILYKICICSKKKLENIYLAIIIPISMLYMFFVPIGQIPDENRHYYRSSGISSGNIITPSYGNEISNQIYSFVEYDHTYKQIDEILKNKDKYNGTSYISEGADNYNPLMYIFSSSGLVIGNFIGLNDYINCYLGRIFNLIAFIIVTYFTIKVLPAYKLLMFVYMLNPMIIHQSISFSADVVVNASTLLYISYILHLKYMDSDKLNNKNVIALFLLSIFVCASKFIYFPLILLLFLIRKKFKNSDRNLKIISIFSLLIAISLGAIWYMLNMNLSNSSTEAQADALVSPMQHLLENPLNAIQVLYKTLDLYLSYYLEMFCARYLGWLNIHIPTYISYFYLFMLLFSTQLEKNIIKLKERIFLIAIFIIIFIAILLGFYVSATQENINYIIGIQGRYFIPVAILFLISICSNNFIKIQLRDEKLYKIIIILLCIINIIALNKIFAFYM